MGLINLSGVAKKIKAVVNPSSTVYTEPWEREGEVFTRGAPINVSSARTEGLRGQSWTFYRHGYNTKSQAEWVDVFDKYGGIRSFKVAEISLIKPKRKYTRRKTVH